MRSSIIASLTLLILFSWGNSALILFKAHIADFLIRHAWTETLREGREIRPWAWADMWPIADIEFPSGDRQIVLSSADGSALAFGAGRVVGSPEASEPGTIVIAGHRDTHFKRLRSLKLGDRLILHTKNSERKAYTVASTVIMDTQKHQWPVNDDDELHLVTCFPFDSAIPGGSLRYVVVAAAEPHTNELIKPDLTQSLPLSWSF